MAVFVCMLIVVTACSPASDTISVDAPGTASPWFAEEAQLRGLDFEHHSGFSAASTAQLPLLPEIVGGGAALADLDGDGDLDVYLVQSGWRLDDGPEAQNQAPVNRLYLNRGDGYFDALPGAAADNGYGMGVTAGDYDNDGDIDLYVTNVGPNALLRNDGGGVFENVAAAAGVDDPSWSTAAAFLDLDGDNDLDLFVVNYINWSVKIERDCHARGNATYCSPTTYQAPAVDRLFRNNGDGSFTDVTLHAGLNRSFGNGLGLTSADFNDDGLIDLFVANDKMVNQLWLNRGNLTFEDESAAWGCAVDEHGIAKAGMGVAAGDVDNDGDTDLIVVNLAGETDSYFRNEGGYFVDVTSGIGLGAHSLGHTRFGVALADFDNDGWLDLYEANGKVDGKVMAADDAFAEPNVLYRGHRFGSGEVATVRFLEVQPKGGVASPLVHTSRAVAVGDVDDDGGLDLLVVNRDSTVYLLMNRVEQRGNWVRFHVVDQNGSSVHGATVSLSSGNLRLHRAVRPTSSYLASHDPRVHFGLGAEPAARDVKVRWPGGQEETFGNFEAGMTAELRRGTGTPVYVKPTTVNDPG